MQMKRGSILAETVLVMPLLLLLIFGVIQFALIWTAKKDGACSTNWLTSAWMTAGSSNRLSLLKRRTAAK